MKAYNIDWDTDEAQTTEDLLDYGTRKQIAEIIQVTTSKLKSLGKNELYDMVRDRFHHCPALMDKFYNLPESVTIPNELKNEQDITEWLSDKYGCCIRNYKLDTN